MERSRNASRWYCAEYRIEIGQEFPFASSLPVEPRTPILVGARRHCRQGQAWRRCESRFRDTRSRHVASEQPRHPCPAPEIDRRTLRQERQDPRPRCRCFASSGRSRLRSPLRPHPSGQVELAIDPDVARRSRSSGGVASPERRRCESRVRDFEGCERGFHDTCTPGGGLDHRPPSSPVSGSRERYLPAGDRIGKRRWSCHRCRPFRYRQPGECENFRFSQGPERSISRRSRGVSRCARPGARADGRAVRIVGVRSGKIKMLFSQLMALRTGR